VSNWKDVIGAVAPTIATMFGGPLAGVAVRALSTKLLGKEDGTEEEVAAAVASASPETLAKIKETEKELKLGLAQAGVKIEEVHAGDRASARALAAAKGISPQVILSAVFLGGYFWALMYVVESLSGAKLDPDLKLLVAGMLGMFSREIPTIMQFWFGSSNGSKEKDAALSKIAQEP
jgi:hypothetical protein